MIKVLVTWRCGQCDTILFKHALPQGSTIEIKCYRCNTFNTLKT